MTPDTFLMTTGDVHFDDFGWRAPAWPATRAVRTCIDELTPRETEVLERIARGRSNVEIADEFVVSIETVKTHVKRVLSKVNARSRAQAVRIAYEAGLVRPGEG